MKAIVFSKDAAGALRELERTAAGVPAAAVRVVVAAGESRAVRASGRLPAEQVLAYSGSRWLLVWLRLLWFLKLSSARLVATAAPHAPGMKMLALALRGRLLLAREEGDCAALSLGQFLLLAWKTAGRRVGDVCLVGTASPGQLRLVLQALRKRCPASRIHALLPAGCELPSDSTGPLSVRGLLAACRRRPRFTTVVIPWSGEGSNLLKALAWFVPLGFRQIYNENLDCYSARELGTLFRHLRWRAVQALAAAADRLVLAVRRSPQRLKDFFLSLVVALRRGWQWSKDGCLELWSALIRVPGRVNILGTASPERLRAIVAVTRRRYPGAPCHGLLPARRAGCAELFDSVTIVRCFSPASWMAVFRLAFGPARAGYFVLPLTREGHLLTKLVFWFLPLGRREIYNENYDFCSARELGVLGRHLLWRLRSRPRPVTVTVLGTASGLFLQKILADLRRKYPHAPIHGLLPARLIAPAAKLFDSYTRLNPLSSDFWSDLADLWFGLNRSAHLIVPCTKEGFCLLKLAGFCLPLGLREIYNENGDAYLARDARMMTRHLLWRLRHRIFYQALTVRDGRGRMLHLVHLLSYPVRLLSGALLLLRVRTRTALRGFSRKPAGQPAAVPGPVRAQLESHFDSTQPVRSER
jgi:hypothetical protein